MPRDNGDGYDDRPKKSWSEIDKARDGRRSRPSGPPGSSGPSGGGGDRAAAATYSRFKSAADRFFSGEEVPIGLVSKLDPTGENKAHKEELKKLRDTEDSRAFATLAKEFVDASGMPDDPYLLDRMLGHPDEALVHQTLAHITELLAAGTFKVPKALPERLKSLELGSDSHELQDAAKALAKTIRDRPR